MININRSPPPTIKGSTGSGELILCTDKKKWLLMHSKWIFCAAVHSFYKQNLQQQHLFFIVRRYMCTIHSV